MDPTALKEQIRHAFDNVAIPPPDALPDDFRRIAGGRHWATLSAVKLFLHRASLDLLEPAPFAAYIAAYMTGGLVDGPYETDLLRCALEALTPDRLEALDDAQRAAVAMFRELTVQRLGEAGIRNYTRQQRTRREADRQ
jgi:hypothetical protein